jgi:hypothetical protein
VTLDQVFGQEITEEILAMVRERLLAGGNLAPRGCDRRKAKLALLLVLEINPWQCLTRSEAALVHGISEDRLREVSEDRLGEGEFIVRRVNL